MLKIFDYDNDYDNEGFYLRGYLSAENSRKFAVFYFFVITLCRVSTTRFWSSVVRPEPEGRQIPRW